MAVQTRAYYDDRVLRELFTSGVSVAIASAATNPIEVIKVRQQLAGLTLADGSRAPGLVMTGTRLIQNEGVVALGRGLSASITRASVYGSCRLGLYSPLKRALGADGDQSAILRKSVAGIGSGSIAAAISNPIDLIKTRQMSPMGGGRSYYAVLKEVLQNDGVTGLWKGTSPGVLRAGVLTASQMATYDEVKRGIIKTLKWNDDARTHFATSMLTGLVCTTVTSPVDVLKTKMFVGGGQYTSMLACARELFLAEGLRGFFKGWTANYIRVGPNTTITFLVLEQLRVWAGLGNV
jgi:solute carrier family 25 uncoupling protein 8/9